MAKVIRQFQDKETKVDYKVGADYTGSKERVSELVGKGYLSIEEPSTPKKKK